MRELHYCSPSNARPQASRFYRTKHPAKSNPHPFYQDDFLILFYLANILCWLFFVDLVPVVCEKGIKFNKCKISLFSFPPRIFQSFSFFIFQLFLGINKNTNIFSFFCFEICCTKARSPSLILHFPLK